MPKEKLSVRVGSTNKVKIEAVRRVLNKIFEIKVEVKGVEVDPEVSPEPLEKEVLIGARNRARKAIGEADFGIGIEAGLFFKHNKYYDVQYCVIVDKDGNETIGHGPGFWYPRKVIEKVKKGETIGDCVESISGIEKIGTNEGSISFLTRGILNRKQLTEQAVLMAMVPRIRDGLYP
jgi:inosine/xanthosine triphosphatase